MADGTITFSTALDNSQLEADLEQAGRDIDRLKAKLERKEHDRNVVAEQMRQARDEIAATAERVSVLKARLEGLKAAFEAGDRASGDKAMEVAAALNEQVGTFDRQMSALDGLEDKWRRVGAEISQYSAELDAARQRQSSLAAEQSAQSARSRSVWAQAASSIRGNLASAAGMARDSFARAATQAAEPWEMVSRKISSTFRKVFVFSLIVKAVKALRTEMAQTMAQSRSFAASVENLKAVCRGFIASFAQAVMPALKAFVDTLAGIFERVAELVDAIFGTNILSAIQGQRDQGSTQIQVPDYEDGVEHANDMADAQGRQAKEAEKLAKAQDKANKSIMGFDEINALSAESSEDAADAMDDYTGGLDEPGGDSGWTQDIAQGWAQDFSPDSGALGGVLDWLDELKRRILEDVEGPFAKIREGLKLIADGWNDIVEGIKTGDWKRVWQGIGKIVIGVCKVIEGAFGALADWLDEITGGRLHKVFEGLKKIVGGAVKVIEGLLTGDLALAYEGLRDIIDGVAEAALGIGEAIIGGAKAGWTALFDFLSEKLPALAPLFETAKGAIVTILDALYAVFEGLVNGAASILKGVLDIIVGIFTLDGERIAKGFSEVWNGIVSILKGNLEAVKIVWSAVSDWFNKNVITPLGKLFSDIAGKIGGALKGAWNAAKGAWNAVAKWFGDTVLSPLGAAFEAAKTAISGALGAAWEAAKKVWTPVAEWFSKLWTSISGTAKGVWNAIGELVKGVWAIIKRAWEVASSWFKEHVLNPVKSAFSDAWGKVKGAITSVWTAVKGTWNAAAGWFKEHVLNPVKSAFSGAWTKLKEGAKGAWNGIKDTFANVAGFFSDKFGKAWEALKKAFTKGGQVFTGVVDAIVDAFKGLANTAIDGLNWAIAQPFNGMNGILRALNGWVCLDIHPFNFSMIPVPEIPHLATGAVIPPNREFLAVLGDQKRGHNIEAPEDLIRQIVREETGADPAAIQQAFTAALMQVLPMLRQEGGDGDAIMVLQVGSDELARAVNKGNAAMMRRGLIDPNMVFA